MDKAAIEARIKELEQAQQGALQQAQAHVNAAKEQEARAISISGGIAELRLLLEDKPAEASK